MPKRWVMCIVCLLAVLGCSRQEATVPQKTAPGKTLVIGVIPEQNLFRQLERYEPLAAYLSRKAGTKITMKILPRYGNIVENFKSLDMDGAFFGSFTYALAHAKLGVEVLARPVALDNTSAYHGLIFVRNDSRIRTARDMKGKRFAFVDKATTAGYLLPLNYFRDNGIPEYRAFLKEVYFTGTHEDAIRDVLDRKADIGAAKNTVFERVAKADPRIGDELVVLARSPDVPENALALRGDIDPSLRSALKEALLKMHLDPGGQAVLEKFGAQRFIESTNREYGVVVRYAEQIGLNLSTYDYTND